MRLEVPPECSWLEARDDRALRRHADAPFRSGRTNRSRQASAFPLSAVELRLRDRAGVEELLGLVDLGRRASAAGGGVAHVVVELLALGPRTLEVALGHPDVLRDQVHEHAEERQQDREHDPPGLPQAGDVVAAEDVREHGEQKPDPQDPDEEHRHRPHEVEERVVGREHGAPFCCRRQSRPYSSGRAASDASVPATGRPSRAWGSPVRGADRGSSRARRSRGRRSARSGRCPTASSSGRRCRRSAAAAPAR